MQVSTLSIDGVAVAQVETRAIGPLLGLAATGPGLCSHVRLTSPDLISVSQNERVVGHVATGRRTATLTLEFDGEPSPQPSQWIPLTPAIMAGLHNDDPVWVRTNEGEISLMAYDAANDHFDSRGGWLGLRDITHIQRIARPEAP